MTSTEQAALRTAARTDDLARLVYADWLEESGKAAAAAYYRGTDTTPESLHTALVAERQAALSAEAAEAYAARDVSGGYWARQVAALIGRVGYVEARVISSLRDRPGAGEVVVRPSSAGRWGKSRVIRHGRPLSASEMLAILEGV